MAPQFTVETSTAAGPTLSLSMQSTPRCGPFPHAIALEPYVRHSGNSPPRIPPTQGFYLRPTILSGLKQSHRCVQEEIFGPVVVVLPFDNDLEAVTLANEYVAGEKEGAQREKPGPLVPKLA